METLVVYARAATPTDSRVGSARQSSNSASGLVSTLIPTGLFALAFTLLFCFLRTKQPRQYAPRTYLGSLRKQERTPPLPNTFFGWIPAMNKISDTYALQHNSIDSYFLLRFLKISVIIAAVGTCITWPILFPVNATGKGGQSQLDMISMANVKTKNRYYAHTFVAWIFISFVIFMVTREMIYFINTRQAYLLSPLYASRISSRTVLFTSVPTAYADEAKIRRMYGSKLKNVWIACDTKELAKMVDDRTKAAMKLEGAETKLIKAANDARLKSEKKGGSAAATTSDSEAGVESGSVAGKWISPKQRPTHRLKPLIGTKVDTINWAREEIARLTPLIEKEQATHRDGEAKPLNAVFIEFYSQTEAQAAYQMVAHHQPLHMTPRVIGFSPNEVVWSNLSITWKTRTIRNMLTVAAVVVTIIFWSIPVAFVGALSNINYLVQVAPFLSFIDKCPKPILGLITSLLPTILLAVLMALLPIYLRFLGKVAGIPTLSGIELRCHESYFWFQVVQVFLIVTMTSAASAAVPSIIKNPGSVPDLLATNLPKASNFYISYFVLQGLTFASGALLQIVGLILSKVLGRILDGTPRKMYSRWANLSGLGWGTVFPVLELLIVIAITYSIIAPLVLGFATVGLFLFYFAFRYNILFVNTSNVDTKGLVYPKALQHLMVGCYLSVICLIGLFGIKGAAGPIILMVIYLIFMVLFHLSLNAAVKPLLYYLPQSLESEEEFLMQAEEGTMSSNDHNGEKNGAKNGISQNAEIPNDKGVALGPAPHDKPSMIKKFLHPEIYADYATMRRLVPRDFEEITYPDNVERDAYNHPAVRDTTPLLWVPRDVMGVSKQECAHTNKVTPITDEGAGFDDKGKITWDQEGTEGRPPVYQEKIYY